MEFWNHVLHTALLGTDKERLDENGLGPELETFARQTDGNGLDKEDRFLRMAAVAFNYRQAGAQTAVRDHVVLKAAPAEAAPYASPKSSQVLADLFAEKNISLIGLWVSLCARKGAIVDPEWLPALFQLGLQEKDLRQDIASCGGYRGVWLAGLNPEWNYTVTGEPEEDWQTGTIDQRRQALIKLRQTDPATALEWLKQTWASEDANTKTDLIRQLAINIGENDLSFLESLQAEKSKKVKDEVLTLLKKIPGSPQVRLASELLLKSLTAPAKGSLFGRLLSSKTAGLEVRPLSAEDQAKLKPLGIDLLSNRKELSDDEFIVSQLLQFVPVEQLETSWSLSNEELIKLFDQEGPGQKLMPSLVLSILHYSDHERALALVKNSKSFYLDLLPLLPVDMQDAYSIKFFADHAGTIIQYATRREEPWSTELALAILGKAPTHPYQYNKAFFTKHISLLPVGLLPEIGRMNIDPLLLFQWEPVRDAVIRLLELKQRTINAFNE